jgi:hypothetical protein
MEKKYFDQLVKGVREMKRHVAGKTVRGGMTTEKIERLWSICAGITGIMPPVWKIKKQGVARSHPISSRLGRKQLNLIPLIQGDKT